VARRPPEHAGDKAGGHEQREKRGEKGGCLREKERGRERERKRES